MNLICKIAGHKLYHNVLFNEVPHFYSTLKCVRCGDERDFCEEEMELIIKYDDPENQINIMSNNGAQGYNLK